MTKPNIQLDIELGNIKYSTNVKDIIQQLQETLLEYPYRNVLMTFETDSSNAPHMDIARIVALQKREDTFGEFYIVDRQFSCIPHFYGHTDYCRLNNSKIGFNKFDSQLNPEKIKDFIGIEGSEPNLVIPAPCGKIASKFGGSIEKTMGGGYYCSILPFLDNHLLSLSANGMGGTSYEHEIRRTACLKYNGHFIDDKTSHSLIRQFIFNLRNTYRPKEFYRRGLWQRYQLYLNENDSLAEG